MSVETVQEKNMYPSTEIILNTCVLEYQKESQRTSSIDGKTNIFITLSTALYAFFIPLSNLKQIFDKECTLFNAVTSTFLITLIILAFLSLLMATFLFISVISSRAYKAIDVSALLPYAKEEKEQVSVVLSRLYDDAINYNRNLNEKRMKLFKKGVIAIVVCIILTTITYFLKVNLL